MIVGEGVLEGQACCCKFGPAGRASSSASPHPATPAVFGIVLVEAPIPVLPFETSVV